MNKKSIYEIIIDYLKSPDLPEDDILTLGEDFKLPQEKTDGLSFVDGAMDGITVYHMGSPEITEEDMKELGDALNIASTGDYEKADIAFEKLCKRIHVINFIDEMQNYIIDHKDELSASDIYGFALHMMMKSAEPECVKAGMMIMELFNLDDEEKQIIRLLGLSDEFTIYAVFLMRHWEDGNTEIMNLAKAVNGWGKIHAVHFIEAETEEIKQWLLTDAVSNYVMPAYSGYDCYEKAGVEKALERENLSNDEIKGILAIIDAMLDEGPVPGISLVDNPEDLLAKVLVRTCKYLPLEPDEAEIVNRISDWQEENGEDDNPEIENAVDCIFCNSKTREKIKNEVAKGNHIYLAKSIGLPYKEELFTAMRTDFDSLYSSCRWLMDDSKYTDDVLNLFRENMNLKNLQIDADDNLGLGNGDASKLDFILQELRQHLNVGEDFVEAAIGSPVIRNRNGALNVLESWVSNSERPLVKVSPNLYQLLTKVVDNEPDESVHNRMELLLSGKITFGEDK